MNDWLTETDLSEFAKSLHGVYGKEKFAEVWRWANLESRDNPDTLSPEFQLASAICDVFARHCQRYQPDRRWMREDLNDEVGR